MKSITKCKTCSKEFVKRKSTSKYCSVECQHKGLIKHNYSTRECLYCDKVFVPCRDTKGMYCSKQCQWNSMKLSQEVIKERQQIKDMIKHLKRELNKLYKQKEQLDYTIQHIHQCRRCGKDYYMKHNGLYCSDKCRRKYNNACKHLSKRKRIYKNGKPDLSITLTKLYMRDNGVCQLCGKHINFDCDSNSNNYPSIDHIVPIAKGGTHSWDNVQLACRICNSFKQDKL